MLMNASSDYILLHPEATGKRDTQQIIQSNVVDADMIDVATPGCPHEELNFFLRKLVLSYSLMSSIAVGYLTHLIQHLEAIESFQVRAITACSIAFPRSNKSTFRRIGQALWNISS